MNKALYNNTRDIFFPTAVYPDPQRVIKQYRSNSEQGFRINNIVAFKNLQDQKNNNFSLNYITESNLLTNFIDLSKKSPEIETIITRLVFYKAPEFEEDEWRFIYVYNNEYFKAFFDVYDQIPVSVEAKDTGAYSNNYYFELEIINNYYLRVKHNINGNRLFLNWDEVNNRLGFLTQSDDIPAGEGSDVFRYSLDQDSNQLVLYKIIDGDVYVMSLNGDEVTMAASNDIQPLSSNTIHIDYNFQTALQSQNNDFISYKALSLNALEIDLDRSLFDESGQYMFHCEYNNIDIEGGSLIFNFLTLDTSRSEYGFIKRGTNMVNASDTTPTFNYRKYNTLDTGLNEEGGHDKISLSYTFYDKDIYIQNGAVTVFKTLSSIYPFERLNINDSTFVKNGAFSGPTPELADKVYIKQTQLNQYSNGRYLCTWLSAGDPLTPGVWVDRYYYPDVITKEQALSGVDKYIPSFNDYVDTTIAADNEFRDSVTGAGFFDKGSDVCLTPNSLIKYERVGNTDIKNIVLTSSPILSSFTNSTTSRILRQGSAGSVYSGITENNPDVIASTTTASYDGSFYTRLSVYEAINKSKEFTISFDAYIDTDIQYGFNLLGNNTNTGFGLFQDMTVTPFLHIAIDNNLHIYNTDGILLNTITFDTKIRDVFKRSALQNFIVTCTGGGVYRVDAKGNKLKIEVVGISDYINSYMGDQYIYFLLKGDVVKKLSLFDLSVESNIETNTFAAYASGGVDVEWYEGIVEYKDKIYLLPSCSNKIVWETDDIIFYVIQALTGWYVIKHNLREKVPIVFLRSDSNITDLEISYGDVENSIYMAIENQIHQYSTTGNLIQFINFDDIGNSDNPDSEGPEESVLVAGGRVLAIDSINEYMAGGINNKRIVTIQSDVNGGILIDGTIPIPGANANSYVQTIITNYNNINHIYDSKSMDFRLTLRNKFDSEDIRAETISYSVNEIDNGFHTFTFTFNSIKGSAILYVDGILYKKISFEPGKYNFQNIFNDELFIGTAGFKDGLDLSTYLRQPGYYYVDKLNIKNLFIYDSAASETLVYALSLLDSSINELILSIPHGQRNNKATIERFYKLSRHNSSKSIDIIVNNFNIDDDNLLSQIKLGILKEADSILPVGVKINNIRFAQ